MKRLLISSAISALAGCAGLAQAQVPSVSPSCGAPVLTVPQGSNITLNWSPPTMNTDGSTITGVVTYNVYSLASGKAPAPLANGQSLTVTTNTRSNLSVGTPCYAITATVAGVESSLSANLAVAVVAPPPTPNPPVKLNCTITVPVGGAPVTGSCTAAT